MCLQFINRILLNTTRNNGRFIGTLPQKYKLLGSIPSLKGYSFLWPTVDEVTRDLDLSNKTCLITGGTNGIGLEITKCLLSKNCNVLMACRNPYAANVMKNHCDNTHLLRIYEANLASLASVKNCFVDILKDHKKIDIVLLNAAVFGIPWTLTTDGLETIFQVNFLSQYYLLMNIEQILAPDARVVFLSAESHRNINWDYNSTISPTEDMLTLPEDKYTSIKAYNVSKLCGILTMHYLGYRWLNSGKSVFCAHPGYFIKTGLCTNWWVYEALYTLMLPFSKSVAQGASTPVYCATSPDLKGLSAIYYNNCERCEESDLAKDSHLSFKINDIVRSMLTERVPAARSVQILDAGKENVYEEPKKTLDDTLISSYSG